MSRERVTDDAQDLFARGNKALSAGEFHEAVECFTRAIRLRPDVSVAYRHRAYAYLELGDRTRALNDLDQAIRLKPDDPQSYADRAAELFAQRQFELAVADCERALKLEPGRTALVALRGRCHAENGNSGAALKDFAAALAADPASAAKYRLWRAYLYLDLDEHDSALEDATAAVEAEPNNPEPLFVRGTVRQQTRAYADASADFTAALALKPDHAFALLGRAVCALLASDYAACEADATAFLKLAPEVVRGYEVRGSARKALGNFEGALADFNDAVRRAPGSVTPYNYRAGAHYAQGKYGLAIRDHMEALKRDPRSAPTFNQLAWVWSTCPDPDVRNGERARECATRACELSEWAEPGFVDTLAAACAECGEFDDAIKWQEKALDMLDGPDAERRADYRSRLDLYKAGKPARVTGGT